ncbi:ribonucleotide-diphosphate reductase subunit beta [Salinispora vitiensis]|uniref:ribonucleotide-diphosphate reductase subunit beta n=1 Tax=Salinispora vitiensis TaxID=999544 RepID=UPI00037611D3|nr:ribonucleotide-diphosphate reductase subunit beta [Salinispora vitiensis]
MSRWSTLLIDHASLGLLPKVPTAEVMRHAELVAEAKPKPKQLYERWESQQWSAEAVELERDRRAFDRLLPSDAKESLSESIATFIIGEYTGLDLLAPILTGAPEEQDHLYLGTQIADETRHTRLMLRLGEELLGLDRDPKMMLAQAWALVTPTHRTLSVLETEVVRELLNHPGDYRRWLRAVALFHLVTEGMLALVGQRAIVNALRDAPFLEGVRSSFVAMCRDESRHVSYGLHALRIGVQEGYADDICEIIEQAAPLAMQIGDEGATDDTEEGRTLWRMSRDSLRRQLRLIGVDDMLTQHIVQRAITPSARDQS